MKKTFASFIWKYGNVWGFDARKNRFNGKVQILCDNRGEYTCWRTFKNAPFVPIKGNYGALRLGINIQHK